MLSSIHATRFKVKSGYKLIPGRPTHGKFRCILKSTFFIDYGQFVHTSLFAGARCVDAGAGLSQQCTIVKTAKLWRSDYDVEETVGSMKKTSPANNATAQPDPRRGNRLYLAIWALLGCGAAAYLVVIATGEQISVAGLKGWLVTSNAPDREVGLTPTMELRQSADQSSQGSGDRWTLIGQNIADLQADVTEIRTVQQQDSERVARLEAWRGAMVQIENGDTVPRVEQKPPSQTSVSRTSPAPTFVQSVPEQTRSDTAIEGTTLDGVTRTSDLPPESPTNTTTAQNEAVLAALLANQGAGSGEITPANVAPENASLTTPTAPEVVVSPPKPAPAIVPIPGQRVFGVELATGDSVDSLRLSWALLNERHRDLLGRLAPRFVQSGTGANSVYRLIAGPFPSPSRARELCTQLKAYYVACQASAFTGTIL